MPSSFFDDFFTNVAGPTLRDYLYSECTYTSVATAGNTSFSLNVIFNEQVFAVDDRIRGLFTAVNADLVAAGVTARRGDYFVLTNDPDARQWKVVDTRDDDAGMVELRAECLIERL